VDSPPVALAEDVAGMTFLSFFFMVVYGETNAIMKDLTLHYLIRSDLDSVKEGTLNADVGFTRSELWKINLDLDGLMLGRHSFYVRHSRNMPWLNLL
jgi:hypothetical protein